MNSTRINANRNTNMKTFLIAAALALIGATAAHADDIGSWQWVEVIIPIGSPRTFVFKTSSAPAFHDVPMILGLRCQVGISGPQYSVSAALVRDDPLSVAENDSGYASLSVDGAETGAVNFRATTDSMDGFRGDLTKQQLDALGLAKHSITLSISWDDNIETLRVFPAKGTSAMLSTHRCMSSQMT
jgi:hypothetical protein